MKKKAKAYVQICLSAALTVFSGLALVNNISAVVFWWAAFNGSGGDAALIPDKCPGIIPWLDWTAVDYSCATTLIPFMGFLLITLGLAKAIDGRHQDPEFFPFFRAYDQLNIALGLIGTLWGIIIIGYFKMDTVTMGDLMLCLHTALFSTLMAVVWVFIVDHSFLRPRLLDMLHELQGSDHEDEDIIEVIEKLNSGAAALCDVWAGNKKSLVELNDSVSLASAELRAFGGVGKEVSDILTRELTAAVQVFISKLTATANEFESRQSRLESAFAERQKSLEASHVELSGLLQAFGGLVSGIQTVQEDFAASAEKLAKANTGLIDGMTAERTAANTLRVRAAELQGESEGRMRQINDLLEQMRTNDESFNRRLEKMHAEIERISGDLVKLEGEKQSAVREADESHRRADRAEKLLEKIKSAFNV